MRHMEKQLNNTFMNKYFLMSGYEKQGGQLIPKAEFPTGKRQSNLL